MSDKNSDQDHAAKADEALNRSGSSREEFSKDYVRIPVDDWHAMKQQNLEILSMLQKKKWTESDDSSDSDSESDRAPKRRRVARNEDRARPDADQQVRNDAAVANQNENRDQNCEENIDDDVQDRIDRLVNNAMNNNDPLDNLAVVDNINLDDLQQEYSLNDEVGASINDNLASLLDTMSKGNMTDETLNRRYSTYKRPRNTSYDVPKVNVDIWSMMERNVKTKDLKGQRKQKIILTAVNSLIKVAQICVSPNATLNKRDTMNNISDAMGLMFKASKEISMDRRAAIVFGNNFDAKYRRLYSSDIPVTKWLFGDDLKATLSSIDQSSKMSKAMGRIPKKRYNFPKNGKRFAFGRREDKEQRRSRDGRNSWYSQKKKFSGKTSKSRQDDQ